MEQKLARCMRHRAKDAKQINCNDDDDDDEDKDERKSMSDNL